MSHDPVQPRSSGQRKLLESLASLPIDDAGRAYLASRGLVVEASDRRFGSVPASPADPRHRPYAGRLAVPSYAPDGHCYDIVFRCIEDHDHHQLGCRKYLRLPGLGSRIHNTAALARQGDVIDIAEGQMDAIVLEECGLDAVGISGANKWPSHYDRLFSPYGMVRVWGDGDQAGQEKFAQKVALRLPNSVVMMVPAGCDVNDIYRAGGREAVLAIARQEHETENPEDGTD